MRFVKWIKYSDIFSCRRRSLKVSPDKSELDATEVFYYTKLKYTSLLIWIQITNESLKIILSIEQLREIYASDLVPEYHAVIEDLFPVLIVLDYFGNKFEMFLGMLASLRCIKKGIRTAITLQVDRN